MAKRIRLYAAWQGRDDSVRDMGRELSTFLNALSALNKRLKGIRFLDKSSRKEVAPASLDVCEQALETYRVDWATGPTKRLSYQPRFFLERQSAPPFEIRLTCGIPPLNLGSIFTPNRLDIWLRRDAGDDLVNPAFIEALLRASVDAFKPDFGFAGVEGYPEPPLPIFSSGVPGVSWMTFLSWRYPPIPNVLPKPTVAHVLARRGTLLVAHPDLWSEHDPAHVEAVEKLREALEGAGVLIPAEGLGQATGAEG